MNFAFVRFQINNTNLVIYDAGSSATNRPVAPDPTSRGWTFSGPGPDTATNAISPDTFWNPTVLLQDRNPMLIPWTQLFAISAAIVSAPPVSLEAGRFHSLALKADGTVAGWGDSASMVPALPPAVVMLAAGDAHNLALSSDRTILAWGDGSLGQTDIPTNATNVIAIAAGQNHSLAARADGTVVQWGNDSAMTNAPASATNVVAVAAGTTFNVALRSNGTVVAWGYSPAGQTNVPSTATGVVGISSGNHTLAVRSNGAVVAWVTTHSSRRMCRLARAMSSRSRGFVASRRYVQPHGLAWGAG
jgi:alpha-tubulin suppressor-like RCC1 family protein